MPLDPAPIPHVPAASLMVFRQCAAAEAPEILMVQRAQQMRFAAGAWVFPGGRVDEADGTLAAQMGRPGDPDATARITAIRETLEETGLLLGLDRQISAAAAAKARQALHAGATLGQVLQAHAWRLDLALLTPFAHWRQPRVGGFDTRFYLADLGSGAVDLAADGSESTRLAWIRAADALAQEAAGGLKVIFPTRRNLERLARFASHAEACADARAHPIVPIVSQVENRAGADWLVIPEGLGYPVTGEPLELARRG